jgi:iron complex transport system substrate-binding protein
MILHVPEVEEKIKELGIPVLIDHSSYEPEPLGRTEWIRFYGALMDREEEADAIFSREVSYAQELGQKENSGKKIAYFAVNSGKTVDVRGGEDYIVKMIRQAGGIYAFDGLSGVDGMTASVSISLEEFYACAADADYLVYNASIQEPLSSVADLTAAYPLLEDLKAVQEGHVFQVRKSLYQSSVTGCRLITDLAEMMAGEEDSGMTFLEKVVE